MPGKLEHQDGRRPGGWIGCRDPLGWVVALALLAPTPSGPRRLQSAAPRRAGLRLPQQRIAAADAYLATRPGTVGYVLRDHTTGASYRNAHAGNLIWTASTIKLAMVVDLLARTYAGQIAMTAEDRASIAAMLHSSDDDAADALWDRYGGPDHQNFNRNFPRYGMTDLVPQRGFSAIFPYWGFQKSTTDDLDRLINYTLTRVQPDRHRIHHLGDATRRRRLSSGASGVPARP